MRDLEAKFDLTHPTVSGILSRLEAGGYLELKPDEHDRRFKRIFLLPKGEDAHRHMSVAIAEMEERVRPDLGGPRVSRRSAFPGNRQSTTPEGGRT